MTKAKIWFLAINAVPMAAYGAAIASRRKSDMMALKRSSGSLSV